MQTGFPEHQGQKEIETLQAHLPHGPSGVLAGADSSAWGRAASPRPLNSMSLLALAPNWMDTTQLSLVLGHL